MKDRIWIVLTLGLLLGVVVGWWGKGHWAAGRCAAAGGIWYDAPSVCGKTRV